MKTTKFLNLIELLLVGGLATPMVGVCAFGLPSYPVVRESSEPILVASLAASSMVARRVDARMEQVGVVLSNRAAPKTSLVSWDRPEVTQGRDCQEETQRVYATVLEKLRARPRLTVGQIAEDIRRQFNTATSYLFGIEALDKHQQPTLLVRFSCPINGVECYSSFRVFQFSDGSYRPVVRSEDFPIMGYINRIGHRLDQGVLEVKLMPDTSSGQALFLTHWIVGGSSPQIFSIVLWKWDGQTLKQIWERLDLHYASSKVLGTIIILSLKVEDPQPILVENEKATWRDEMYRLESGQVVFDGVLDQALAKRYLQQGFINKRDAENLTEWAYKFEGFGDTQTAIQLLEQAVTANPRNTKPCYTLSRIYEQQQDYTKAAFWMRKFADATGGLSEQGKQRLDELERKAKVKQ